MQFKWDLGHVYLYLVCFISLILIIIGAVNITRAAIAYATPVYNAYNPFEHEDPGPWEEEFGAGVIEAEKERFETINRENYRRGLARDLGGGLAFLLIALPVYLYHWRKIPKPGEDEQPGLT